MKNMRDEIERRFIGHNHDVCPSLAGQIRGMTFVSGGIIGSITTPLRRQLFNLPLADWSFDAFTVQRREFES